MESIAQLINYYPKYEYLDDILVKSKCKKLNLFIDIKGCMQSLYQEWAVKQIIEDAKNSNMMDDSILFSMFEFLSFHKIYAKKRGIDINFIIFFETGRSVYHMEIYNKYKNRRSSSMMNISAEDEEIFKSVLHKNLSIIEKLCNGIPAVSVINLSFLEADFIPWYMRKRVMGDYKNECDVIYSCDKDMLQCLDNENTFIFYKHYKLHRIISKYNAYSHFFKEEVLNLVDVRYIPLFLSITGDASDDIPGVPGIKHKTILNNINDIINLVHIDTLFDMVKTGDKIFDLTKVGTNNKCINKIVENEKMIIQNLKLISYHCLSDYLDSGFPVSTIMHKRGIVNTLSHQKINSPNVVISVLKNLKLTNNLNEQTIINLY